MRINFYLIIFAVFFNKIQKIINYFATVKKVYDKMRRTY